MMAKKDVIGKLDEHLDNRFLDWGIRDYFYRVFWDDYPLKHDIELAGNMTECAQLEDDLSTMARPRGLSSPSTEYSRLTKELNRCSEKPNSIRLPAWNKIEKDVLKYFDSDLRIYEDLHGQNATNSKPCYFLDTKKQKLRYYDGAAYQDVCIFNGSDWPKVQRLFPSLFAKSSYGLDIFGQKNAQLRSTQSMQLITLALNNNPDAKFHIEVEPTFIPLFKTLEEHASRRTTLEKLAHDDHRNAEELVADIVVRMRERIKDYLDDGKHSNPAKRAVMENIETYLATGDDVPLMNSILKYDRSWFEWVASWFFSSEVDKTYHAIIGMKNSEFFEKGFAILHSKKSSAGSVVGTEEGSEITEPVRGRDDFDEADEYEYDSHIIDMEYADLRVDRVWQSRRVTKAAIIESLEQIVIDIEAFKANNPDAELPIISFPKDLVVEGEHAEEKTVIAHIEDCIARLQGKIDNDKTNGSFQTDCAFLQKSVNRILNHRYQGNDSRRRLTEGQRSLYVMIGEKLTDDLNKTKKPPEKGAEVLNSVQSVRVEIHRLIKFHNKIREELAAFQTDLDAIDQGTFANDIEDFIAAEGPLDARQKELLDLLDELKDCQDDAFNVIGPDQNEKQRAVCEAVTKLNRYETTLVDALSSTLTKRQDVEPVEGKRPPRVYIVVNPRTDAEHARTFEKIMGKVRRFADPLAAQESSRVAKFFEETLPTQPHHNVDLSMFGGHSETGSEIDEGHQNRRTFDGKL